MKLVGIKRHMYVCMYGQRSITYAIQIMIMANQITAEASNLKNLEWQVGCYISPRRNLLEFEPNELTVRCFIELEYY